MNHLYPILPSKSFSGPLFLIILYSLSCTHTSIPNTPVVKAEGGQETTAPSESNNSASSQLNSEVDKKSDLTCINPDLLDPSRISLGTIPQLYMTKVTKSCFDQNGKKGHQPHSTWMAMGIPCTGGGGLIEWKGKYFAPKMISFELATGCPMLPNTLMQLAQQTAAFSKQKSLGDPIVYNPFAALYWEVPSHGEAGTGNKVTLLSQLSLTTLWKQFQKGEPILVELYGKENAWNIQQRIYKVSGKLIMQSTQNFRFVVSSIKQLSDEQRLEMRQRCSKMKASADCRQIF